MLPVDLLAYSEQLMNSLKPLIHDDDLTPKEDKDKREKKKIDNPKKCPQFFHAGSLNLYKAYAIGLGFRF
jgi:hypothetical protein